MQGCGFPCPPRRCMRPVKANSCCSRRRLAGCSHFSGVQNIDLTAAQEAETGEYKFYDESPGLIRKLVDFLYTRQFKIGPHSGLLSLARVCFPSPFPSFQQNLCMQSNTKPIIQLFFLGDKYDIVQLKEIVCNGFLWRLSAFKETPQISWPDHNTTQSIEIVLHGDFRQRHTW